jgi:hypothetical protein
MQTRTAGARIAGEDLKALSCIHMLPITDERPEEIAQIGMSRIVVLKRESLIARLGPNGLSRDCVEAILRERE